MPPFSTAQTSRESFPTILHCGLQISRRFQRLDFEFILNTSFTSLEFFFEGSPVGIFEAVKYPTNDGEFQYMPYRGFGHYEMWKTIDEKEFATCFYINDNEKIFFKVEDAGKYGKLILSEFRKEFIQK